MKSDWSEKELAMIKEVSPQWYNNIEKGIDGGIAPPRILDILALDCFLENKSGKAVDSLRRCVNACHDCNPYRMTNEYDDLIEV